MKLSQRNYVQQPGGKSIVCAETSDFYKHGESAKYETLFKELGFHGLVMVEAKEDSGKYFMIEANPRFWGPSQLFVDANFNLFEAFLHDHGMLESQPEVNELDHAKYLWYGGIIEAISQGGKLADHSIKPGVFAGELAGWLQSDVYNRDDTRELFIKEAGL
jgi:predicted ATP-grasp superfamily ATP-dependent carboligase